MGSNIYHTEYAVDLPRESVLASLYEDAYLSDAYGIIIPPNTTNNPEAIARFLFSNPVYWVSKLMSLRDFIVGWFGLKTAKKLSSTHRVNTNERVHIFKIYQQLDNEIILGEDDKHLDFRISVLLRTRITSEEIHELVVTTVVHCHNLFGRLYINLIRPFHSRVIRSGLRNAGQNGWPLIGG